MNQTALVIVEHSVAQRLAMLIISHKSSWIENQH